MAERTSIALNKLKFIGTDKYGRKYYAMDVKDDTFIHFTNQKQAEEIVKSKKLLEHPPYPKMGIEGVQAVSTVYGMFSQEVIGKHLEKRTEEYGPIVGVRFKTSTIPEYGWIEEVIWKKDVNLKTPEIISYSKAKSKLNNTPEQISDNDQVVYSKNEIERIREYLKKPEKKALSDNIRLIALSLGDTFGSSISKR